MSEKLVGSFLLDGQNDIDIQKGQYTFVGNEYGGILVDTKTKQDAQVWGKEGVWLLDDSGQPIRKRTLKIGEKVTLVLAGKNGSEPIPIGEISYSRE